MTEPTRAQEAHLMELAARHDQVRVTPLADGSRRVDCMDRGPEPGDGVIGTAARGLMYSAGWILAPDGSREPVRW